MDFGLTREDFKERSVLSFLTAYVGLVVLFGLILNRTANGANAGFWGLGALLVLGGIAFVGLRGMGLKQMYRLARSSVVSVVILFVAYIIWFWIVTSRTGSEPAVGQGMGLSQQIVFGTVLASVFLGLIAFIAFASKFLKSNPGKSELSP